MFGCNTTGYLLNDALSTWVNFISQRNNALITIVISHIARKTCDCSCYIRF